jgi:hypothetical protein
METRGSGGGELRACKWKRNIGQEQKKRAWSRTKPRKKGVMKRRLKA